MNHLILGILLGAALVVFCLWCMERGAGVTNEEVEAWQEWRREEWERRRAFEEEFRAMGAEEMPMARAGTKAEPMAEVERKLRKIDLRRKQKQ